ncbi:MAG: BlaI/MecI/CopY family transcriptional regulator [Gemmatimonas sp.]|nr:BlaI/MecI/CopY family transcriptional regulator [Gemmatimonas sp.]
MDQGSELSRRERQIMDVLYARGRATVAEVMGDLPNPPSYSAVRATLRILEEKGHVYHEQDGPRYVYVPAVEAERARKAALGHLVATFFDGSAEEAMVTLLRMSDARMTDAEVARIRERIRDARRRGR